LHSLKRS